VTDLEAQFLMHTSATSTADRWRGALLACLVGALLPLRAARAQELFPTDTGPTFVTPSPMTDQEPPLTLPPPQGQQSEIVPAELSAEPKKGLFLLPCWDRFYRCVPEGIVPYVGPRTPDERKDCGLGLPLVGRGWRSQPFAISGFAGFTDGSPLIQHHVNQEPSFYGGANFSWDYDHYWGIEKRLGFGALNLSNGDHHLIADTGFSVTGEYRLMYYPLGDARWRPFLTAGVGWSDFYFNDDFGKSHLDTVGMIPFGLGVKYLWTERIALRMDLIDEFTFGTGELSNFHYVALTAGLEFRYGQRLLKMPWHRRGRS
jgi:hypothetical protein